jgi:hypothetical protein
VSTGVSKVPTPTVAPAAQAAVDAYIAFYNISNEIDANPAHADVAKMNQYLTGKALTLFDGVVTSQRTSGTAYRGIPPQPRVTVGTIFSPTFVVLSSCPAQSRANPFVQIYVDTGKPVPVSSPAIAPPYKITISMQKINGAWKVADLLVDTSKTCTG